MWPQGTRDGRRAYHSIREPNSIILPIQVRSRCEYYNYLGAYSQKSHSKKPEITTCRCDVVTGACFRVLCLGLSLCGSFILALPLIYGVKVLSSFTRSMRTCRKSKQAAAGAGWVSYASDAASRGPDHVVQDRILRASPRRHRPPISLKAHP